MTKEISGSLEYKTAIVDHDFLTSYLHFLDKEEMPDLDFRVGTKTETYTEMTIDEILNDLEDTGKKITNINITAYERREFSVTATSVTAMDSEYYKRRRRIEMSSYGHTLDFSISGTNQVWVEGIKAAIKEMVNDGTWFQKFLRGKPLWSVFYFLCFSTGILVPLALAYRSLGLGIAGIVTLVLSFALGVLLILVLSADGVKILPYSYKERRTARRLSPIKKREKLWDLVIAFVSAVVGGFIGTFIGYLIWHK